MPADLSLIPGNILQQVVEHAEAEYPFEGCGLLIGSAQDLPSITEFRPMANRQGDRLDGREAEPRRTARSGYWMAPEELLAIQKEIRKKIMAIKVIYHSHVDAPAVFSAEDIRMACPAGKPLWMGVNYLIVSVIHGKVRDIRFFSWSPGERNFVT
jgi:proteasome lid subunit RPN8/RPN11